jgi:adenylyltransferase/sulfurtransferase
VTGGPPLTPAELRRYARHFSLPEIGEPGQRRLRDARVLLVGAGGLGSPAALYLAAAGVGVLGLVDDDRVDETNLQRQILYGTSALGRPKGEAAAERLHDLNPHVHVERFATRLTSANALDILRDFALVVDGSDNFPTRYLVSDACVLLGKRDVYGAIFRFEGQVSVFGARGPCYRCLFRDPPPPELVPSCEQAGVLGVVPGVIGSLQALEAVKLITGVGEPLAGRLLMFDGLPMRFRELRLRKDPECPACGEEPTIRELIDYEAFCGTTAAVEDDGVEWSVRTLQQQIVSGAPVQLVDVREPWEWSICRLDDAVLLPLRELPSRFGELDPARTVVAYCHSGWRSLVARQFLLAQGFGNVRSLRGGVEAWAAEIDPSMARY